MTKVIFYEKPGCSNNARQKQLLTAAGHELDIRDLLTEAWTADLLRSYFDGKPVAAWFNKAAPKIKSGEIQPDAVDADMALTLMLAEPILIRRPLMEAAGRRNVGFDPIEVEAWIGLEKAHAADPNNLERDVGKKPVSTFSYPALADLETCRRTQHAAQDHASKDNPAISVSETNPS